MGSIVFVLTCHRFQEYVEERKGMNCLTYEEKKEYLPRMHEDHKVRKYY